MIKVVAIENMRRIEAVADAGGLTYDLMMENAGHAAAERALAMLSGVDNPQIVVLVGVGNNGGDGLVAARYLAQSERAQVHGYLLKPRAKDDTNFHRAQDAGVIFVNLKGDRDGEKLRDLIGNADLLIDALFGIGIRLPIQSDAAKLMENVNTILRDCKIARRSQIPHLTIPGDICPPDRPLVLAIDCPSGLDCDTGEIDSNTISADETITFIAAKPGLLKFPGAGAVGRLSVATIGIPETLPELQTAPWSMATADVVCDWLPERRPDSHKGTYGKAMVVAGSLNYIGAPGLAAEGAYRAGAGLVTVAAPGPVVTTLAARLAEPTWLMLPHDLGVIAEDATPLVLEQIKDYQSLLLGPGWGQEDTTGEFLRLLLESAGGKAKSLKKRALGFGSPKGDEKGMSLPEDIIPLPPLVIDADGLNLLAKIDEWWKLLPEDTIITPHPGEMSRLANLSTQEILAGRWQIAAAKATEWKVVLVLKGAHTLIAAPDGRLVVLPFKTDALASGGTGDILAGMIVGMLAQGVKPFEAAIIGGYAHGLAGEFAQEGFGSGRGVIAGDILKMIPAVWPIIETA